MSIVYKIRNKETGLYNDGVRKYSGKDAGWVVGWNNTGKIWHTVRGVRTHMNACLRGKGIPLEWEVVEFDLTETGVKDPTDFVRPEKIIEALKG